MDTKKWFYPGVREFKTAQTLLEQLEIAPDQGWVTLYLRRGEDGSVDFASSPTTHAPTSFQSCPGQP